MPIMMSVMQKHKKAILYFIIIFIGVPFVFFVPGADSLFDGSGSSQVPDVIAQVGKTPIMTQDFLRTYGQVAQSRVQGNLTPSARELVDDGTVELILEQLINEALIAQKAQDLDLDATKEYFVEMLQTFPDFQTEAGEFDARYWNQWIEGNQGQDWNAIYDQMRVELNRRVHGSLITAAARVFESDIRKEFESSKTKLKVKHTSIEPKIELTEEELNTHYEANRESYMTDEERTAEFVVISLEAPEPESLTEILTRANEGEDFEVLITEFNQGPRTPFVARNGWLVDSPTLPDYLKALFEAEVGSISDPIKDAGNIYVINVTEERDSTLAGKKDIKIQQIALTPTLSEEARQERLTRAESIAEKAKEEGGLTAVAEAESLTIQTTNSFSLRSSSIDGLESSDLIAFRSNVSELEDGITSDVIEGNTNLLVAKVVAFVPAAEKTFEDSREDIETDAVAAYKLSPEYLDAVDQYLSDIEDQASNLEDVNRLFPELECDIKETDFFGVQDFLFTSQVMWLPRDAFPALQDTQPGQLGRPITDFSQTNYILELVERQVPSETTWEEDWPIEKESLSDQALRSAQFEHQQDYLQHLNEEAQNSFMIQRDDAAIALAIGLEAAPEAEEPVDTAQNATESE